MVLEEEHTITKEEQTAADQEEEEEEEVVEVLTGISARTLAEDRSVEGGLPVAGADGGTQQRQHHHHHRDRHHNSHLHGHPVGEEGGTCEGEAHVEREEGWLNGRRRHS